MVWVFLPGLPRFRLINSETLPSSWPSFGSQSWTLHLEDELQHQPTHEIQKDHIMRYILYRLGQQVHRFTISQAYAEPPELQITENKLKGSSYWQEQEMQKKKWLKIFFPGNILLGKMKFLMYAIFIKAYGFFCGKFV